MKSLFKLQSIFLIITSMFLVTLSTLSYPENEVNKYGILLKHRSLKPKALEAFKIQALIENCKKSRKKHLLIQFKEIPSKATVEDLEAKGIKFLDYIPNGSWIVSLSKATSLDETTLSKIRWLGQLEPIDKISPTILEKGKGLRELDSKEGIDVVLGFFSDVSLLEIQSFLEKFGGDVEGVSSSSPHLRMRVPKNRVSQLAGEDIVKWIERASPGDKDWNDGARRNIKAIIVQEAPYSLDGLGIIIGQWESGNPDQTHDDLLGRITVVEDWGIGNGHGTRVAGTMAGDGTLSETNGGVAFQWKGMAPSTEIISYSTQDDDLEPEEHNEAISIYGIDLSNNSFGIASSSYWGLYTDRCSRYDAVVTGIYGKRIPIVFSAGNFPQGPPFLPPDYGMIGPPSTAKNVICVGNIKSDENCISINTGFGPTEDGRIKPDLLAPGDENWGESGIKSCQPPDTYAVREGTSYSAPCISGSIALLLQRYRQIYGPQTVPLPSTVKALLMHTAVDHSEFTPTYQVFFTEGPDYKSGYGDLNIKGAVDQLDSGNFLENEVGHLATNTIYIEVPQWATQVKITLVWDDEPGSPLAEPALVNDLDLKVYDPNGERKYPWTLDPLNPDDLATRDSEDHLNNIEQVFVDSNVEPGTWTVEVYGYAVPENPPQKYSLVYSFNCPATYYVSDTTGSDIAGDGSQTMPWETISHALYMAVGSSGAEADIRVAEGHWNYWENVQMGSYENLYGGYSPVNWSRDIIAHETMIYSPRIYGTNQDRVVSVGNYCTLDGFTIRLGEAAIGAGVYADRKKAVIINSCVIRSNDGLGDNSRGGGLYVNGSDVEINNSLIVNNTARWHGGIYLQSIQDDTFAKIMNCTIVGNSNSGIGAVLAPNVIITNCVLWDNEDDLYYCSASYSCISDGDPGEGNISDNPSFLDAAHGDYHLSFGSPCIDAGSNTGFTEDFEGDLRPLDGDSSGTAEYDMGADEYAPDSDGDGLRDYKEIAYGTDPSKYDTDDDGLSDYDEVYYDGYPAYDPYDPETGEGTDLNATEPDTDGDGFSDYIEINSASSPIDQNEKPPIIRINFQPGWSQCPSGYCLSDGSLYSPCGYGWQ